MKIRNLKKVMAYLLVAAQIFAQVSVPVYADEGIVDTTVIESVDETVEQEENTDKVATDETTTEESNEEPVENIVEDTVEDTVEESANEETENTDTATEIEDSVENENETESVSDAEKEAETNEENKEVFVVKVIDSITEEVISETEVTEGKYNLEDVEIAEHDGYNFEGLYIGEEKVNGEIEVLSNIEVIARYSEVEKEEVYPEFNESTGIVRIEASEGIIPEGTEIKVEEISDTEEVENLVETDLDEEKEEEVPEVENITMVDIKLEKDGEVIQPEGNVDVTVDIATEEDKNYYAYYFNGYVVERIPAEKVDNGVKFTTDHFSKYVVAGVTYTDPSVVEDIAEEDLIKLTLHYNGGSFNGLKDNETIYIVPFDKYNCYASTNIPRYAYTWAKVEAAMEGTYNEQFFYKPGYKFVGWCNDEACENVVLTHGNSTYDSLRNLNLTDNIDLYAKWEQTATNKVTIQFNLNGGLINGSDSVEEQKIGYQDLLTNPGNPEKENLKFIGWYVDSQDNNSLQSIFINGDPNNTNADNELPNIYWDFEKTTLQDLGINEELDWHTLGTEATKITLKAYYVNDHKPLVTVNNYYGPNTGKTYFVLDYKGDTLNNAKLVCTDIENDNVELIDDSIVTNEYIKRYESSDINKVQDNGYILISTDMPLGADIYSYFVDEDVEFTMNWETQATQQSNITPIITFDLQGGYVARNNINVLISKNIAKMICVKNTTYGSYINKIKPVKQNKVFAGWYYDSDYTQPVESTDLVTESKTIYAKWATGKVTVDYVIPRVYLNSGEETNILLGSYQAYIGDLFDTSCINTSVLNDEYDIVGYVTNIYNQNPLTGNLLMQRRFINLETDRVSTAFNGLSVSKMPINASGCDNWLEYNINWFDQADLDTTLNYFGTGKQANTLTVQVIVARKIKVVFDSCGGSSIASQDLYEGQYVTRPEPPTKENAEFIGWFISPTSNMAFNFNEKIRDYVGDSTTIQSGTNVKKDNKVTLYARWRNVYTINYHTQGGNEIPSAYVNATGYLNRPVPVREGYNFMGWYRDPECTISGESVFSNLPATDLVIDLYADWLDENKCLVKFDVGTYGATTIPSQEVDKGGLVTNPGNIESSDSNYVFVGWYTSNSISSTKWNFTTDTVENNMTLYAVWARSSDIITVTFASKDDSRLVIDIPEQRIVVGTCPVEPEMPNESDADEYYYVWNGKWFLNSAYGSEYSFSTPLYTDSVIYYGYEYASNHVYFKNLDNSGNYYTWKDKAVRTGYPVVRPDDPTSAAGDFIRWTTNSNGTGEYNFDTPVTDTIWLYAQYARKYTVTYESNGGTAVDSQRVPENEKTTAPTAPTKSHSTFKGWYKDSNFETPWNFDTDTVTGNITLYAKWETEKFNVNFVAYTYNPETGLWWLAPVTQQSIEYNSKATEVGLDSIDSHLTFDGWYKDTTYTDKWNFDTDVVTGETTLYAKGTRNNYNVEYIALYQDYDSNHDWVTKEVTVDTKQVAYGDKAVNLDTSTITAGNYYSYNTWYSDKNGNNAYDFNTLITGDLKLYTIGSADIAKGSVRVEFKYNQENGDFADYSSSNGAFGSLFSENSTEIKNNKSELVNARFIGWYNETSGLLGDLYTNDAEISVGPLVGMGSTISYVAYFTYYYTVSFDSNGGSTVTSQTVDQGDKATEPVAPTKAHYIFKGWYTDSTLSTPYDFNTAITSAKTLYAKWELETFEVTFDSNGGTTVDSQTIGYNNKVVEPTDPTKPNAEFLGWYKDNNFETPWNFDTDKVTENTTIYAKWVNTYEVTFDSNGGTPVTSQTIRENEKVVEPIVTKTKAELIGWYKDSSFTTPWNFTDTVTENITLYAKWVNTYEVTFESNGGSTVTSQTIRENEKVVEPTNPTRARFEFKGWYKDALLNTEWNIDTDTVTRDMTLYAKWEGALSYQKDLEQAAPITFTWNDSLDKVKDAMKDENDSQYDTTSNFWTAKMDVAPADATTLEASYTELQDAADTYEYSVAFDITIQKYISTDEEVTDVLDSSNVTEPEEPLSISFSAPTLPNNKAISVYDFYRVHNGALDNLPIDFDRENNIFTFESDKFSEYVFYYEIADVYTVSFDSNGGSSVASQSVIAGNKASEPTAPTKSNHRFDGWYTDDELQNRYDFNTPVTSNIELHAKWVEIIEHTVTFNTNGGNVITSQTVLDDNKATQPSNPVRNGFTFKGWYTDTTLTHEFDFNTPITSDITLNAKWHKNVVPIVPDPEPEPDPEPTPTPTPTPDPEPTPIPTPTPTPKPIPTPDPVPEDEPEPNPNPEESIIPDIIEEKEEEEEKGERVYTYVETTEFGYVVNSKKLKTFDIHKFF